MDDDDVGAVSPPLSGSRRDVFASGAHSNSLSASVAALHSRLSNVRPFLRHRQPRAVPRVSAPSGVRSSSSSAPLVLGEAGDTPSLLDESPRSRSSVSPWALWVMLLQQQRGELAASLAAVSPATASSSSSSASADSSAAADVLRVLSSRRQA